MPCGIANPRKLSEDNRIYQATKLIQKHSMPSLSTRPITAQDWRTYKTLRLQSLQDAPNAFGSTYAEEVVRSDGVWATRLQHALASQKAQIFFALLDGQACGLVWCKSLDDVEATVALYQMWVAPQARRCGAGSALINAALAWSRSKAAQRLQLEVTTSETAAIRFYQQHGFVAYGEHIALRDNSNLRMQPMLRLLTDWASFS